MRNTLKCWTLAFLFATTGTFLFAQENRTAAPQPVSFFNGSSGTFSPEWVAPIKVSPLSDVNGLVDAPLFKGAAFDNAIVNLPYKDVVVAIRPDERLVLADVNGEGYSEESVSYFGKTLQESKIRIQSDWYPAKAVEVGEVEIRAGQYFQHLRIYPLQISPTGGRIRKATSINYALNRERIPQPLTSSNKSYADNSVLSSGSWVKVGVTGDGVYRLDYQTFQDLGLNPSSIDPRTIRVHGKGGGVLPQTAGEFPYDDLPENSIWVSGEADGRFDPGDFVLFYGQSPHTWEWNDRVDQWIHNYNVYTDTTYYFLSYGQGNGKRIVQAQSPGGVTQTPAYTDKFVYHEVDDFNPLGSGRVWLGESFDLTTSRTFSFGIGNPVANSNVQVTARIGGRSNVPSSFSIRENGTTYATISVPNTNTSIYGNYWYRSNYQTFNVPVSNLGDGSLDLNLTYSKPLTSSIGYLDYLEVVYQQRLNANSQATYSFYARENVGPGEVQQFNLPGSGSGYRIWDLTDPVNVREQVLSVSGNTASFAAATDSVKAFYAFNGSGYRSPASLRRIGNQNLHALPQAEYLIISHSNYLSAANRLAQYHRNFFGRTVNVINVAQIYNEFSSGMIDPTAIRDFIKMFYDRAMDDGSEMPRYVLMMGDGSYDYKYRTTQELSNFIPTYQSRKSQRPTESYTSDDYYGFLDDGEGFWGEGASLEGGNEDLMFLAEGDTQITTHGLDVAIGRMPVNSIEEANTVVDKVINYISDASGFGPWRNRVVLVADHKDADGQIHISQADSYTDDIETQQPCMNIDKIYMDNYLMENTASGSRFPDGKDALIQTLNEGSLIVNYTGHGGEVGWSNASILDISDINNLENGNRLAAYVTATCEFGRWDDPGRQSGAEIMFIRPDGGSIAMFTTVRVVYSGPNYFLNQAFYQHVFDLDTADNSSLPMGEIFRRTKNDSWLGGINNRNFSLMGDPAMPLAYPQLQARVTSINNVTTQDNVVDTLSALTKVVISGEVVDQNGNFIDTYSGSLFATVYDKPSRFTTRRSPYTFNWQRNRVFNGSATVNNGRFSFEFVVPIDISYDDGFGKISLYLQNASLDAAGCNENIFIGGASGSPISDDTPPEMDLFMNDEKFVDGGMVGPDPTLLADIYDENGLNTVGTGIGHELTAVLDGDENNVIVLNDFYAASKDSYQEGRISYPFSQLSTGEHELEVKVWDVANNSATRKVTFVVADDASIALGHVLNYPNPFTTNTQFYVEHNRNGRPLNVQIKIFTVSGRLVKTLNDSFFADGNLYCDLEWDGLDDYGDALGRGVYVYQVMVKDESTGEKVNRFEKLVVLR